MGTAPDRKLRHLEISSSVAQPLQGLREIREKGSKRRAKPLFKHYSQHTVKITGVNIADADFLLLLT